MDLLSLTWDYLTTADSWTAPGGILERLVEQYYGGWERGDFEPAIPVEPPQTRERIALAA